MIKIRPFHKSDREVLRKICCDVADRGEPIENIFPDRTFAADLLTRYYTDYEPESSFVALADGQVVAYINGCFDNRRYGLVFIFLIIPLALIKGVFNGVFVSPEFWLILKTMLRNWRRLFHWRKKSFNSHQGHIHIGVSKDFRGQKIGEKLVATILQYAKKSGVQQIIASVHGGNLAGCRFFEHLGFVIQEQYPMIAIRGNSIEKYNSMTYVKVIH